MAVDITDIINYKRLVTAGNNELWYEDINVAAGTMVELVAANADIDTSDQLDLFEAYQKVFVINGTNLKIADFVNTKLTVTALTTAPTRGSIVTQATSNATMVVDFVNTAKTEIYGYTTSGTFVTTAGYTLSGGSMDPETRVPSAVAQASTTPHWYDYTVYPDAASGSLPATVYLGCLYRGRIVLSGNPAEPYQWYMSRQADHTDLAYIANDAQSPVKGGNSDAGELGDIVRAVIPYKDDYLIFGCAGSIWFLAGDPAEGGSLNELCLTAGILGAKAWTWDKKENLYMLGTTGILRVAPGFGPPENITETSYPDFIKDLAFDPALHRVSMEFDRIENGLLISKVTLADGVNTNWWYDLRTNGLFPEAYPEECGPYSLFYYDSNTPSLRGLLVGCKDGYIRTFDKTKKGDDIGGSDEAIDSYVTFGPAALASGDKEGKITGLAAEMVGGGSGGSITDSSDAAFSVFTGRSADDVAEKMILNTGPRMTGTFSAPGRPLGGHKKQKVSGVYAAIRVGNSTADQTWAIEKLIINTGGKGKVK